MNWTEKLKQRWSEWVLLPFKLMVLLSLPLIFFADSTRLPHLASLDVDLDIFAGWVCLLCSLVLGVAAAGNKLFGQDEAARRSFWFAVLAFVIAAILSPLLARA